MLAFVDLGRVFKSSRPPSSDLGYSRDVRGELFIVVRMVSTTKRKGWVAVHGLAFSVFFLFRVLFPPKNFRLLGNSFGTLPSSAVSLR